MKNLYNKIYKAINEGMVKALLIDNDISVKYERQKISNNLNLIDDYIQKLEETKFNIIDSSFENALNDVITYYENTNNMYKPANIILLNKLFNTIYHGMNKKIDWKNLNLDWIDMSGIVDIVSNTKESISLKDYKLLNRKQRNNYQLISLNINNTKTVIIHKELYKSSLMEQKKIYEWNKTIVYEYPILDYINNLNDLLLFNFSAYLPSHDELVILFNSSILIRYIQLQMNVKLKKHLLWESLHDEYWTSDIIVSGGEDKIKIYPYENSNTCSMYDYSKKCYVLPLWKEKG